MCPFPSYTESVQDKHPGLRCRSPHGRDPYSIILILPSTAHYMSSRAQDIPLSYISAGRCNSLRIRAQSYSLCRQLESFPQKPCTIPRSFSSLTECPAARNRETTSAESPKSRGRATDSLRRRNLRVVLLLKLT